LPPCKRSGLEEIHAVELFLHQEPDAAYV
jgi:hypothetical protein